jgi:hypothetical protein
MVSRKVRGEWGGVVATAADLEPESDEHLIEWMNAHAAGMAAYAEGIVEAYAAGTQVTGIDLKALTALHDFAYAAAQAAETMMAAKQRFTAHYELSREFAANGGLMTRDGRWVTGTADTRAPAAASRPLADAERADAGGLPARQAADGAGMGAAGPDMPKASDLMTAMLIGPADMTWQPCAEHGIPYSRCWACNKPAGICSYGLCGDPPTHVVTRSGRRCCEPHARYLASINGGDARELAPDACDERAPGQGADEVVISLADGDARTAPVLRDEAGGGSYACPWCQSPVFSPEAWAEHERENAAACERLGEVHQPQPYPSIDAAAWQARGCANPMCWVNLPAGQLTDARRRREETEARDRERERAERARQQYKDEYGQRRHADNQTWGRLQADAGITTPPGGGSRARRGDLIVVCQEHPSFGAGDPYDSYTVGVVTSVTRDGGVKAYRPAGDLPEPERAGRAADKGTDLARQRPDRFWVLPADGVDVPAALATAACHTWPDSQFPQPYESLDEVRAVMQPHLAAAPAGRREALRVAAARWEDARRQARAGDGYEARLAAARDADEAYRRAAENSALRTGDRIVWRGQTYDLLDHVPAAGTITARTIPAPGPRDPLNRDLDVVTMPLGEAAAAPFDRAHADRQMYEAIGRNRGWDLRWEDERDPLSGNVYRYWNWRPWYGSIRVRDDGFHWAIASHQDGTPIASGTTTRISEAFAIVTRPADHGIDV